MALLAPDERAVLQFSGGKDSAALLLLARPVLGQITVLFADTGAAFPHVRRFVETLCARVGARLEIVRPAEGIRAFHAREGLPVDLVPVESAIPLQSYIACCSAMLWQPMDAAVKASGAGVVLRGAKAADARVGMRGAEFAADGIVYRQPLWDWSDADVLAFLAAEGVDLPEHYAAGVPDSLDCHLCTAHLAHGGAEKMRFMKARTPDLWAELAPRLAAVKGELLRAAGGIGAALGEIE